MKDALPDQIVDRVAGYERRVELNKGLGPQQAIVQTLVNMLPDSLVTDPDEARNIGSVITYESVAQLEDVHEVSPVGRKCFRLLFPGS